MPSARRPQNTTAVLLLAEPSPFTENKTEGVEPNAETCVRYCATSTGQAHHRVWRKQAGRRAGRRGGGKVGKLLNRAHDGETYATSLLRRCGRSLDVPSSGSPHNGYPVFLCPSQLRNKAADVCSRAVEPSYVEVLSRERVSLLVRCWKRERLRTWTIKKDPPRLTQQQERRIWVDEKNKKRFLP